MRPIKTGLRPISVLLTENGKGNDSHGVSYHPYVSYHFKRCNFLYPSSDTQGGVTLFLNQYYFLIRLIGLIGQIYKITRETKNG